MLSPSQRNRIHEIDNDLRMCRDKELADITDETLKYVQDWLKGILDNNDGMTAYWLIYEFNNNPIREFVRRIMNKAIMINLMKL